MRDPDSKKLNLAEVRKRLGLLQGRRYWRSLEELAQEEEFLDLLRHEFPAGADVFTDPVGRRRFLQLMGASLALAGITSCTRQPEERIVPYVRQPEQIVPGKPLFFATAMPLDGFGLGLLVESHDGRPTKVEGNPDHPASLGATSALAQASVLDLYDPDRAKVIKHLGRIRTWNTFTAALATQLDRHRLRGGEGLRVLTGTVTSPTLAGQLRRLQALLPGALWHQYDPCNRDQVRAGSRLAFGTHVNVYYRLERAFVILSLDADFLCEGPAAVRYARDFAARRRVETPQASMNRLYMVESTPTGTGTMADHRLGLKAGEVMAFAQALAAELGLGPSPSDSDWIPRDMLRALARDLQAHPGSSAILVGDHQPAQLHALALALNERLGNFGQTVVLTDPVEADPGDQLESLHSLVADMEAGKVETLILLGGNPVFNAPADFEFERHLQQVPFRVHLSREENETTLHCHWHIPESHYLEAWGDVRAFDGTVSIIQPLIEPLYDGRSPHQMLAALLGQPNAADYDLVRDHWSGEGLFSDFERAWRRSLHDGWIQGTSLPHQEDRSVRPEALQESLAAAPSTGTGLELIFRPDPTLYDGRFANNGWLQELPKPLSKLTWDNAALVSPSTAETLGLSSRDRIQMVVGERTLEAAVWVLPGHPPGSVTLHLGYGRSQVGRVGKNTGFNAYRLRTSGNFWFGPGLEIHPLPGTYPFASTQHHFSMEGRHLVREGTLEEFRSNPHFVREMVHLPPAATLYPPVEYSGYAWGMAIDLNACTGCNACVVACQAENNIPVVGKEQVIQGREMHWIRIDRYYEGDLDDPAVYHQPVPCMHCENAPCEPVCPVGATVHSDEGLNDMVYNRCVGTRYCSNNCPYKVRRFNFLLYSDLETPSLKLLRNPDVTVRTRGVMEKCTYCVQRINEARIQAKLEDRKIRDGEIQTACQQACPSQAIVFGDINDPESRVARWKANPRHYAILEEVNTKPRTTYLARLKNPNPEVA